MTAQRARAARAIELQSAREDAGLTVEQLAGRVVDMWDARLGEGRRAKWQETVDRVSRDISYLERASHQAYERADAWGIASTIHAQGGPDTRTGRGPRVDLHLWREALATSRHEDLRDALATSRHMHALSVADRVISTEEQLAAAATDRAHDIATLVWNSAADPRFLDEALFHELSTVRSGDLKFIIRSALVDVAKELHLTFPNRPARELRSVA